MKQRRNGVKTRLIVTGTSASGEKVCGAVSAPGRNAQPALHGCGVVHAPYYVASTDGPFCGRLCSVLDSAAEQDFRDICVIAADVCGTELSYINVVDWEAGRLFYKAQLNSDITKVITFEEVPEEQNFCVHSVNGGEGTLLHSRRCSAALWAVC